MEAQRRRGSVYLGRHLLDCLAPVLVLDGDGDVAGLEVAPDSRSGIGACDECGPLECPHESSAAFFGTLGINFRAQKPG